MLSLENAKLVIGIPFFADVRGVTSQFAEDDSNLEEMKAKTEKVLSKMHEIVTKNDGVHIQFQGDREVAIFHEYGNNKECYTKSVISAMRLLDEVKNFEISIGVIENCVVISSTIGTPQGGPLSSILSNIYLDKFDNELEMRGLHFVRYANDCNIFVRSDVAAERVIKSVTSWLERKLFLKVSATKTKIVKPMNSNFLGFTFWKSTNG